MEIMLFYKRTKKSYRGSVASEYNRELASEEMLER